MKELILNSFYFGTVCEVRCGVLQRTHFEQFLHVEQCGGLERTDFEEFLLWKGAEVGVVVLTELVLNSFYCREGVVVLKKLDFEQFLLWDSVVVIKELILNSFKFGRVYEGKCGGLKRSDLRQFLLWEGMIFLKDLDSFYCGRVW